MFCDRCGTQLLETQNFCPSCGKGFGRAPVAPPPARGRVTGNVHTLGILWLVYSAYRLITGWFLAALLPRFFDWWPMAFGHFPFLGGLMRVAGLALVAKSVLGFIVGWGLLERQSWARVLAIIAAILELIKIPFGTALGIYTLWVLVPAESCREYEQIARA